MRHLRLLVPGLLLGLLASCSDGTPGARNGGGGPDPDPDPGPGPQNSAPVANAGADQAVDENAPVTLDGAGSTDAEDGTPAAYQWTQLSGPAVTLDDPAGPQPSFEAPTSYAGTTLTFRLRVLDTDGAASTDTVQVAVSPTVLDLAGNVDPIIGSFPPGFTNPGAVAPFGMVTLGPDTEGPISYGGYYFHNALLNGFSHVHMSAGVFKAGYFPVLPFVGELDPPPFDQLPDDLNEFGYPGNVMSYASPFEHATEVAEPGYYASTLLRYGVQAELTATERVGMHRYTFLAGAQPPRVLFHVSRVLGGYGNASARLIDDGKLLVGRVHSDGFDTWFAAHAEAPFTAATADGTALDAVGASGDNLAVVLDFPAHPAQVLLKVAVSYTDEAGAIANLAEIPDWDFDRVRGETRAKWNHALSRIRVQGGTAGDRISFYSALYRLFQFPNLHSDVDGRYRGPDGQVHDDDTRPHYSQFSSWDSYRAQNAMQAELFPHIYRDMVLSLLDFHAQAGFLPRWQQGPKDASHMSGDPIIPFIGEAWCRGQLEEELRAALWPALANLPERRAAELKEKGYLSIEPAPLQEQPELQPLMGLGPSGASATLEYGIGDFSLALMAQHAAPGQAGAIVERSLNYRRLQDTDDTGFIRPRLADGGWLEPFHPEFGWGFQEGTSWQYTWLAMHDYAGLFAGMGGAAEAQSRLDEFFAFPAGTLPLAWPTLQNQITLFGIWYGGNQYAPGNEHDLEGPYVYHYAGAPWKSQAVARAAASIYTPTPNGLPGNDDLGALSGWLLWTMAGLFPNNPGTPLYVLSSPYFEQVVIKRDSGDLVIDAPGASNLNPYVTQLWLDDVALDRPWLIVPRGKSRVTLTTAPLPDTAFGATVPPPSVSTHGLAAFGCVAE